MSVTNNDSIVLEEEIDPNYVPSEEDVVEYATWMGMDLDADRDLFWIAREGLMAPLPMNWKPCKSKENEDVYYFNFETAESSWDHPCDGYYKRLYEEEKKKKETSKKAENDTVRTKARQDVDMLLGKSSKKKTKSTSQMPGKGGDGNSSDGSSSGPAPMEKKALPGIRGKVPLDAPVPLRNALSASASRDSTPERGRADKKSSSTSSQRPASADATLGGGSRALGSLPPSSLSAAPLPTTVSVSASKSAASFSGSDRAPSPEFTDSDASPIKQDRKSESRGREEKPSGSESKKERSRSNSKNSRIHNAVAVSSDFGSPDPKAASSRAAPQSQSQSQSGGVSDAGLKPKAVLGRIGGSQSSADDAGTRPSSSADAKAERSHTHTPAAQAQTQRRADDREDRDDYEDLRNEISRLSEANASLSDAVGALTADCDRERKQTEVLSTSQNVLRTQLSTAREESRNLRSELNREIERRARIESELKEVSTQCGNAKKENATHVGAIQDMRAQIHNLEGEINLSKNAAADFSDPPVYSQLEVSPGGSSRSGEVDALQEKLKTSQLRVLDLDALVVKLRERIAAVDTTENAGSPEKPIQFLEKNLGEARADAERKQRRIRELEGALRGMEEAARAGECGVPSPGPSASLLGELSGAKAQVDALTDKLAKAASELAAAHRDNEEHLFKSRRLESQVSIRQSELEDTESRLAALKRKVSELQDRCDDLEVQNKSLTGRLGAEGEEKQRLEARLASAKEDIKSLQSQVASLERASAGGGGGEEAGTANESARLYEELNVWKSKCHSLQSKLDATTSKLRREDEELACVNFELATQVELTDSLRQASARAGGADTTADASEALRAQGREALEQLKAAQAREAALQAELTASQRREAALEDEAQRARGRLEREQAEGGQREEAALAKRDAALAKRDAQLAEAEQKSAGLRQELGAASLKHSLAASSEAHRAQGLELELERVRAQLQEAGRLQQETPAPRAAGGGGGGGGGNEAAAAASASVYELEGLKNANKFVQSELDLSKKRTKDLETELHSVRDEKEKMYFEHVHAQGEGLEAFNAKLAAAAEAHAAARAELMPLRLQTEELSRRTASLQDEIASLKKDAERGAERREQAEREWAAARERAAAEGRQALQAAAEGGRELQDKLRAAAQELTDSHARVSSLEQQAQGLGLDKQRLREALEAAVSKQHDSDGDRERDRARGGGGAGEAGTASSKASAELAQQREREISRLQSEVQALGAQRDALKAELAAKVAECVDHLRTIAQLRSQLERGHAASAAAAAPAAAPAAPPLVSSQDGKASAETQREEAKQFFDSLMATYQAQMETAMRQQIDSVSRREKSADDERAAAAGASAAGRPSALPTAAPPPSAPTPAWGARGERDEGEDGSEDSPLHALRGMLGAYMAREPAYAGAGGDAGAGSFSLLPSPDGGADGRGEAHMEQLQGKIGSEKKLIQVGGSVHALRGVKLHACVCVYVCIAYIIICRNHDAHSLTHSQELKGFLRKENDLVRKKQHGLSSDRDAWRQRYQQQQQQYKDDNFRAAKKVCGDYVTLRYVVACDYPVLTNTLHGIHCTVLYYTVLYYTYRHPASS
jgi:DNA repair exonuclease SbcCD ATPase subunit